MLATGTRLGPYEIRGLVGEGGMGQVYRAADTRLDRAVAIKILPATLAADPMRRERFEREARSISKLEHPNICPLYDVGELPADPATGAAFGLFLVMQYLEGESLAQRLEKGPLTVAHTLEYGIQIADALGAAHRAGIVHRDLKPANVMLTRTGARLLDFGLARPVSLMSAPGAHTVAAGLAHTSLTTQGTLLGTLHYMAPEQLDGREVDTRADVFAFGAVLFEMLTGMKAFEGESPARVMSAILRDEPTRVASVVPVTPAGLDELIHACLAKDPGERWQGMSDVARQLRWLQASYAADRSGARKAPSGLVPPPVAARRFRRTSLALAVAIAIGAIASGAFVASRWTHGAPSAMPGRLHAYLLPPEGSYLAGGLALSPDGRQLAFVAADANGARQLWIRPLDAAQARPLDGTSGASDPFWSPLGDEVAFFAGNQLKRVAASGGTAAVICAAGAGAGGTWSARGTIVFQPHQQGPLMQVPASGGAPTPVTTLDTARSETHHLYPTFLPDGRHFVFYVAGSERGLHVAAIDSDRRESLFDPDPALAPGAAATPGVYAASGHLLYVRDRVLMARPFDAEARRTTGPAVKLVDTVDYQPPGEAAFAVAGPLLVYRPRPHLPVATLGWVDRSGRPVGSIATAPGSFRQLSLDPTGRRLALDRRDAQGVSSVWLIDLAATPTTGSRIPAAYWSGAPVWSADGRQLAYSIAADSPPNLAVRGDGSAGAERRLTRAPSIQYASDFTPDGRTVLFRGFSTDTGWDLFTTSTDGESTPAQRFLQTRANESDARLSPDGHTVAYTSDGSGRTEVYLAGFPDAQGARAVSAGGGIRPMWRRDGRELYFVSPDSRLMAASITPGLMVPSTASATPLFQTTLFGGLYVPAPDGQRFLVATPTASDDIVAMELIVNALGPAQ